MKTQHTLFFAIPYDSATYKMYERIRDRICTDYESVSVVIGNQEVGPSPEYSKIATFKAQNRELNEQFVAQIRSADIVVADLTHNNPNVHIELGIALTQNKNIFRVTGRSITELGFDIRNLEVYRYGDEEELEKKICDYLEIFFKIKDLPLSNDYPSLYAKEPRPIKLCAFGETEIKFESNIREDYVLRDGGVEIEFEFIKADTEDNWFGLFFRAGSHPFIGSHLVLLRNSGEVKHVVFPGAREDHILANIPAFSGRQSIFVQFENNTLAFTIGAETFWSDGLSLQTAGRLFCAARGADVKVHSAKAISRDTIDWL
jgi:hypothetical protein